MRPLLFRIFSIVLIFNIISQVKLSAQPEFDYLPNRMGWHTASYDFSTKEAGLIP